MERTKMKLKKFQPTLSLKPTQFAVGLLEVEYKVSEMKKLRRKKLQKLVRDTPIPVVVSPWTELCVVDHHHFLFACWHAGITKVRIEVVKDYSKTKLSYHRFWQKMARSNFAYLYDQFGSGPQKALYLPMDVRGMADDPYRSLAWMVRKEGGYENSTKTFAEFQWADLFRSKGLLDSQGRSGFHKAVIRGLRVAGSPQAKGLPGFIDRKKMKNVIEEEAMPKSKYVPRAKRKGDLATVPQILK
jgi:hypothetical protein